MTKFTSVEKRAYDALVDADGAEMTLDQIGEKVYGDTPRSRSRLTSIMRMLILKTERDPVKVVRTSQLGRSSTGVYRLHFDKYR